METANTSLERSIFIMKTTLLPNALFIVLGALAIFFNTLIILIIISSKMLKTKCFILLGVNSWSDFLLGVGYMGTGSVRVYRHLVGNGELVSMFRCSLEVSLITFAQLLSLGMAVSLVVDRVLAAFCAHHYKNWTYRRVTVPLLMCAHAFAFGQLAVHFHDSWIGRGRILESCGIEDTLFPTTLSALTTFQMSVSGVIVLLYGVLGYGMWRQKKQIRVFPANSSNSNGDSKIIRAVTVIVILHISTHLGGRFVILFMALYSDDVGKALTNRYGREVVVFVAATHFFILYMMSNHFRAAAKKFFRVQVKSIPSILIHGTSSRK